MIYTFIISFYDWNPFASEQPFVGLDNYAAAFSGDPLFLRTLGNTAYYTAATVLLGTALALAVAAMIHSLPRLAGFFRTVYFLPVITSVVATSIMWRWLYQDRFGLINQLIRIVVVDSAGLTFDPYIQWLTSKSLAMPSVIVMSVWQGLGFTVVLFLAGLTAIPRMYYEAARIDGAGNWDLFRYITLPLLRPTTTFVVVTGVITGMQVFTPMYLMTSGGPANATKSIVQHLHERAFSVFRFGYASSLAFILFALILGLTFIQLRLMRTQWDY